MNHSILLSCFVNNYENIILNMVNFCAIVGCSNRGDKHRGKRFFRLPAIITRQGSKTYELSKKRREEWLARIRRCDIPQSNLPYTRVCSDHFINGEPSKLYDNTNPDWAPTLKLGYVVDASPAGCASGNDRYERAVKRRRETPTADLSGSSSSSNACNLVVWFKAQVAWTREVQTTLTIDELMGIEENATELTTQLLQCQSEKEAEMQKMKKEMDDLKRKVKECQLDEDGFRDDDEKVKYYTGLCSWQLLMVVLNFVKSDLKQRTMLSPFQQLLLALMKMRLNLSGQDLAYRFYVSKSTVSRTFLFVIGLLYVKLKPLIVWPVREILYETMPMDFRKYCPRCAVTIDCFEIFIERPTNLLARSQTFSSYKHHNTVKYLIGITPQGTVCFISDGWGGRVSDKHLTENSGLLNKLLPGDTILADRGFDIQESIGLCSITVKIPAFTKGKPQLSGIEKDIIKKIFI